MWKLKLFREFISSFQKLDNSRWLLAVSSLLLAFLYPGHNSLQTIVINPGEVRAYSISPPALSLYPKNDGVKPPGVSSRAVIVQDAAGKAMMYEKNPDTLLMPASITKVMTALVAIDHWTDLETIITVKNEDRAIGQTIELQKGEQITLQNILYGLLVHSGNDAALAVADNFPGGYSAFVAAMNAKAKELHLDHTTFKNPSGVEQYGHTTTARDIAVLASIAMSNPLIAEIVQIQSITVTDVTGIIVHKLETTNELLGVIPGLKGLKTGWTTNSGECFVSYIDRDGKKIIVVVLGSLDRFGDTAVLVDWAYTHHNWITPVL